MEQKRAEADEQAEDYAANAHGEWVKRVVCAETGLQELVGRMVMMLGDVSVDPEHATERVFLVGMLVVAEAFALGVNASDTPARRLAADPPALRPAGWKP